VKPPSVTVVPEVAWKVIALKRGGGTRILQEPDLAPVKVPP